MLFCARFGAIKTKIAHIVVIWGCLRKQQGVKKMDQTVAALDSAEQLSDSQGVFLRLVAIFVLIGGGRLGCGVLFD